MIINEGGINWNWFTAFDMVGNNKVRIIRRDRLHNGDYDTWPQEYKDATTHPAYYHERIWREAKNRIAAAYNVPGIGWCEVVNKAYIFSYK